MKKDKINHFEWKLVRIPPDIIKEVKIICKKEDRTIPKQIARLLREAIKDYKK